MALKKQKSAAVQALDAIKPKCCEPGCDTDAIIRDGNDEVCGEHYERRHADRAVRSLDPSLLRRPDESADDYRRRMMAWLRENARIKRFGRAQEEAT